MTTRKARLCVPAGFGLEDANGTPTAQARLCVPAGFGLTIQHARMARGLSPTQLAEELGVSQSAISEIESENP